MHNFSGIQAKVNSFRKGYIIDAFDQPTFLSFALDFRFEGTNSIVRDILWASPLFEKGSADNTFSAQTYLGSIGHKDKEKNLAKFKDILEYLTFNAPWYFQEITGLDKLWQNATNMKGGNKSSEAVLTINTLEAIDLRIAEIANLYRTSIYDKESMRERVPDNLRWFAMDIYIAEARYMAYDPLAGASGVTGALGINTQGISRVANGITSALGTIAPEADLGSTMNQFGYIKFKCRQCEFDFSDSMPNAGSFNASLENGMKAATGKFKINVGYFEEESQYQDSTKLSDSSLSSSMRNPWSARNLAAKTQNIVQGATFLPLVGDSVSNALDAGSKGLKSIGGLINPALNAAFSKTSYPYLGKLY